MCYVRLRLDKIWRIELLSEKTDSENDLIYKQLKIKMKITDMQKRSIEIADLRLKH